MRKYLIILTIGLFVMSCSKSPYEKLADQFPKIESFPHEFIFSVKDTPEPIKTDLLEGRIRPVGKVAISDQTEMLIGNDWDGEEPEWGDLTGYLFRDGKLTSELVLARDFSLASAYSKLKEDMTLRVYSSVLDPDSGEEKTEESVMNLKELAD